MRQRGGNRIVFLFCAKAMENGGLPWKMTVKDLEWRELDELEA